MLAKATELTFIKLYRFITLSMTNPDFIKKKPVYKKIISYQTMGTKENTDLEFARKLHENFKFGTGLQKPALGTNMSCGFTLMLQNANY